MVGGKTSHLFLGSEDGGTRYLVHGVPNMRYIYIYFNPEENL